MKDLYAETTARIIAVLEQGVGPWVRPWSTVDARPMNVGTRRPYRGINVVLLGLEAQAHGYVLNRWLTYRQALEAGGQVRRGEEGSTVVFWPPGGRWNHDSSATNPGTSTWMYWANRRADICNRHDPSSAASVTV